MTATQNIAELIEALQGLGERAKALEQQAAAAEARAREARDQISDAAADGRDFGRLLASASEAEAQAAALRAAIDGLGDRRRRLEEELRQALPALFEAEAEQRLQQARAIEREAHPLLRKLAEVLGAEELPITTLYTQHARLRDPERLGMALTSADLDTHDPMTLRPYRLRREAKQLSAAAHNVRHGYRYDVLLRRIGAGAAPIDAALAD